jgi:hypothetical protein
MYHYECDYCGGRINAGDVPYVRARIAFITGNQDRFGEQEELIEPTRFFHAHSVRGLEECDRLGIEVNAEKLGDCCYTRALKQLEGVPVTDPGVGMEWRLLPVGHEGREDREARLNGEPIWDKAHKHPWPREEFSFLRSPARVFPGDLRSLGIETFGDLRGAIESGELRQVRGIGQKTFELFKRETEAFLAAREKAQVTA